ncbi:hypothetical protein ABEF93_003387 [Exophiala dermatitidis]
MAMSATMTSQLESALTPMAWLPLQPDHFDGACRTCRKCRSDCDGRLPHCNTCSSAGLKCAGYGVQIQWPTSLAEKRTRKAPKRAKSKPNLTSIPPPVGQTSVAAVAFSSLGLPESENFLMEHYLKNLSRIAIAIDYAENGYRSLTQSSINDPCTLNSILAVAASHYSKWQRREDRESRHYLRKAFASLQSRLKYSKLVYEENTVVAMLSLLSYEIFNGTKGWAAHYQGIRGWLSARGNSSDLNPFIKTWFAMIETQKALNIGGCTTPEVQSWIDSSATWTDGANASIDPFFGCSVRLPRLMAAAAKLYDLFKECAEAESGSKEVVESMAIDLQQQVKESAIDMGSEPSLAVSCHDKSIALSAIEDINHREYFRRIVAAAETFRHAMHIYIYRITHPPEEPASAEIRESMDQMFELLATVPDALGPGSNLGWCLTVLGAELDIPDQREYIRSRLKGIKLLGMNNPSSAEKVLEQVWTGRDLYHQGFYSGLPRWQDIMQNMGEGQILV